MAENSEKFLGVDEFKERVYKNIGTLEALEEDFLEEKLRTEKNGCLAFFLGGVVTRAARSARRELKFEELNAKADALLAQNEIKDLLCAKLDATIALPIDAAYKLTPVLYALALEDEKRVPFDSMLFAVICRKITKKGVENFCAGTETEPDEPKKARGGKPAGDKK
ncbi:MAG TPA: hypothetical protein VIL74_06695 [Pyrinomonadaceae bacterium]|jgi:hypothetical protein